MPSLSSALALAPRYHTRVWGGTSLTPRFGRKPTVPQGPIGESWELCDMAAGDLDDGSARSTIASGPFAGQTLAQLRLAHGTELMGSLPANPASGGFPLLLKYVDSAATLSVQVHPSPAYAAAHPQAHLKSEAWFIVDCKPGAVIYKGLKPGVGARDLRGALATNTDAAMLSLLEAIPVAPGDCHYLPSGICHALGAGILMAEVQTPSDTTFRLYDWGRVGRELHVEQALDCIDFSGHPLPPPRTRPTNTTGTSRMVACDFFVCDHHRLAGHHPLQAPQDGRPVAWMVLAGTLTTTDGQAFGAGDTLLWPAAADQRSAKAGAQGAAVLETTFPR